MSETKLTKAKIPEKCKCGFKFAEPGEFRNCEAFITKKGKSGVVCPDCNRRYVND